MIGSDTLIVRRTALTSGDRYGKQTRDWAAATEHTIAGVSVQPVSVSEATVDREWAARHLAVYAPPGADVLATDRAVWRGDTYEVDGPPQVWIDDGGTIDHVAFNLKAMAG